MTRLKFVLVFVGGVICWLGFSEFRVGEGASPEPQVVELADLESGAVPDNTHLQIGPHWRMYHELVFRYEAKRGADEDDVSDATKVDYAYYPVLSEAHPYFLALGNMLELYGSYEDIPEERLPEVDQFAMLVKTKQHKTVGALPEGVWTEGEPIGGLVVNRIHDLKEDERNLIAQSFPGVSLDSLLVLEEGRRPASAAKVFGMMGGGAGVGLAGIGWLLVGLRGRD